MDPPPDRAGDLEPLSGGGGGNTWLAPRAQSRGGSRSSSRRNSASGLGLSLLAPEFAADPVAQHTAAAASAHSTVPSSPDARAPPPHVRPQSFAAPPLHPTGAMSFPSLSIQHPTHSKDSGGSRRTSLGLTDGEGGFGAAVVSPVDPFVAQPVMQLPTPADARSNMSVSVNGVHVSHVSIGPYKQMLDASSTRSTPPSQVDSSASPSPDRPDHATLMNLRAANGFNSNNAHWLQPPVLSDGEGSPRLHRTVSASPLGISLHSPSAPQIKAAISSPWGKMFVALSLLLMVLAGVHRWSGSQQRAQLQREMDLRAHADSEAAAAGALDAARHLSPSLLPPELVLPDKVDMGPLPISPVASITTHELTDAEAGKQRPPAAAKQPAPAAETELTPQQGPVKPAPESAAAAAAVAEAAAAAAAASSVATTDSDSPSSASSSISTHDQPFLDALASLDPTLLALAQPADLPPMPKADHPLLGEIMHLRERLVRDGIDAAMDLLEQRWLASLTPEQRREESRFWAAGGGFFDRPTRYHLKEVDLFPAPHAPSITSAPSASPDSSGRALTISGRYFTDGPPPFPDEEGNEANWSFHYELCSFSNVCLRSDQPQNLFFHFRNASTYLHWEAVLSRCTGGRHEPLGIGTLESDPFMHALCGCFHGAFRPVLREYEWKVPEKSEAARLFGQSGNGAGIPSSSSSSSSAATPTVAKDEKSFASLLERIDALPASEQLPDASAERSYPDPQGSIDAPLSKGRNHAHYWSINKWVPHHHLAHLAQKLLMFQSLMQHAHTFYQPTIEQQAEAASKLESSSSADGTAATRPAQRLSNPLPPFTGIVFQDSDARTSEHEEAVLSLSLEAALGLESAAHAGHVAGGPLPQSKGTPPLPEFVSRKKWFDDSGQVMWSGDIASGKYATDRPPLKGQHAPVSRKWDDMDLGAPAPPLPEGEQPLYTCFKQLSYTPIYGELSLHPRDSLRWRALMRRMLAKRQQLHALLEAKSYADAVKHDPALAATLPAPPPPPALSPALAPRIQLAEDVSQARGGGDSPATPLAMLPPRGLNANPSSVTGAGCPPRRISMLWRENRRIQNWEEIMNLLGRKFNLTWVDERLHDDEISSTGGAGDAAEHALEHAAHGVGPSSSSSLAKDLVQLQYTSIGAHTPSLVQQSLFLSSGLMISSHSSQLINVLFSPRSASIVEVSPEFHNSDFVRYSAAMGLENYQYMLGGCVLEPDPDWREGQVESKQDTFDCVRSLNEGCNEGEGSCILNDCHSERMKCPWSLRSQNKNLNFRVVDLALFERVVDRAVRGIEERCFHAATLAAKEAALAKGEPIPKEVKHEGWIEGFAREREEHARAMAAAAKKLPKKSGAAGDAAGKKRRTRVL